MQLNLVPAMTTRTGTNRPRVRLSLLILLTIAPAVPGISPCALGSGVGGSAGAQPTWKAGVATEVITPTTPVWLAGYGSKRVPDGKLHDLWMKALALQAPDGATAVLVTSDFQGVPQSMSDPVFQQLKADYGLERHQVMITFSHNHCGPRLGDDLQDYYVVEAEQEALIAEYTRLMQVRMVEMIGRALADLKPAVLRQGQGVATFAVNRRNNREADIPALLAAGTPLVGPVDHSVQILTVTRPEGKLTAVLFGYACHPTTLSFMTWCGDYPGFAQLEIEKNHPGTVAMFVNTCGGDQNPLPRRKVELCERYGKMLAQGVEEALLQPLTPVSPGLKTAFELIDLPYLKVMTREELVAFTQEPGEIRARWAGRMLEKLNRGEQFESAYPYPVHAWRLGSEMLFIGMGAETVVDYALRFKAEFGPGTWVMGYADDMISYIPSRRVWEEGGYEGGSNLYEYGRPALRWAGDIEDRIAASVRKLAAAVSAPSVAVSAAAPDDPPKFDWVKVTGAAGWQPRDSSGEVAFRDKLWIFGGWFDSYAAPPRDVWSSSNGQTWELVTQEAPWKYSDLPMTAVFRDRMWIMGGWYNGRLAGHGATSEVWSSENGKDWDQATPAAGWSPRIAAASVVFRDRLWVLGGTENYYFGDSSSLRNDVWSSADGTTWRQEIAQAPWSPRAYLQAVVHDDRIWVMGGGNYVPEYHATNDVWCSADGIHWEEVTAEAPWSPRLWFSAVTYRHQMWVLGGWSNHPSRNWGDVWYSADGKAWTQLRSDTVWKERHEHSAFVFQDRIFVAGGHAQPLSSEVWSLSMPADFANTAGASRTPVSGR